MVKIQLTDVNDNWPVFYPREYNVSLREGGGSGVVVAVAATDRDSGRFGAVTYRIVSGNEGGLFRIDRDSGEISVARGELLSTRTPMHRLNVSATDGGGLRALHDAEVFLSVTHPQATPPHFHRTRYSLSVREDVPRNTVVGSVKATSSHSGKSFLLFTTFPSNYRPIHKIRKIIHYNLDKLYLRIVPLRRTEINKFRSSFPTSFPPFNFKNNVSFNFLFWHKLLAK
jgi:hypothetical protein